LVAADLAVPDLAGAERLTGITGLREVARLADTVVRQAATLTRHRQVLVPLSGLDQALRTSPVRLSTMGRGLDDDPAYFLASSAAGRHAANLLTTATC
jgi:hypothetical protein